MVPEVAVTVTVYVPAGVPGEELGCVEDDGPVAEPLQAASPATTTSSTVHKSCGVRRFPGQPEARSKKPDRAKAIPERHSISKAGRSSRGK
jgi:hypothetical protein